MNYLLMYNDIPVIKFNTDKQTAKVLHSSFVPYSCINEEDDWQKIKTFCSNRVLLMNRKYCKEILNSCQIDNQTDIEICIIGKALSFRDNYWIKKENSLEKWKDINLYNNSFSREISFTALTGKVSSISIEDNLFTGELTALGTRAKCFERRKDGIYLIKEETTKEIFAEIIGAKLVKSIGLPYVEYNYEKTNNNYSVCKIKTNLNNELIPARDILLYTKSDIKYNEAYYDFFVEKDAINFIKMQLIDYITLNTDRNRDNFGLLKTNGKFNGLFPIFDLDSFFKGINENAYYFVTGLSYQKTFEMLITNYPSELIAILPNLEKTYKYILSQNFKAMFLVFFTDTEYEKLINRTNNLLMQIKLLSKEQVNNHNNQSTDDIEL